MKCTKLLSKLSTDFLGSMKCTKFVMGEMYEIGHFLAEFEYEYCRIWLDEMCEIAQQAKYRFLGVDEMYKICDG